LPPEPAPLRLPQAQGTRPDRARRIALRLPALTQGRPSRPPLPLLPQAPVRPPRQQPLPSPAGPATPSRQPARSRLPPRRHRHPTCRRSLGCSLIAPCLNDNVRLVLWQGCKTPPNPRRQLSATGPQRPVSWPPASNERPAIGLLRHWRSLI